MDELLAIRRALWFSVGFFVTLALLSRCASAQSVTVDEAVQLAAYKHGVSPRLIKAVIMVESKGNPAAVGAAGEIGLMQLHPRVFKQAQFNIVANVDLGAAYLAKLRKQCPYKGGYTYVVCYNKGLHPRDTDPTRTAYYNAVTKELQNGFGH